MAAEVVIDARFVKTGLGRYTYNLLAGLAARQNPDFAIRAIVQRGSADPIASICGRLVVVDTPIYSLSEQIAILRAASGCDLLHVPHYNVPLLYRGRLLISISDLVHIMEPQVRRTAASWCYARPMLNLAARKARHVITVSEYSKQQIVEHLRITPAKVSVIYNGVGPQFRVQDRQECARRVSQSLDVQGPFLLYVGNLKPHKNLGRLLQALTLLRQRRLVDPKMLVVGEDAKWKSGLVEECARLGVLARSLRGRRPCDPAFHLGGVRIARGGGYGLRNSRRVLKRGLAAGGRRRCSRVF